MWMVLQQYVLTVVMCCVFCAVQDPGIFRYSGYSSVCECGWRGPGECRVCRGTSVCAALGP